MSEKKLFKCPWCGKDIADKERYRPWTPKGGETQRYHINTRTGTDCLKSSLNARLALLKREYFMRTGKEYESKKRFN